MGNHKRIYGNDKFETQLNAKELILKKINADSNWVDLYVYSLMLGEDLRRIGDLMVSEEVTKLVSEYNTNLWTDPIPKIKFISLIKLLMILQDMQFINQMHLKLILKSKWENWNFI